MSKILLSIKPEYAEKIFSGTKKYEYRHTLAQENVDSLILYETSPIKMILGEVKVLGKKEASPTTLWEETKSKSGISREKYRKYFHGQKTAKAYILGKAIRYLNPFSLDELGLTHTPQSFMYLPQCPFCGNILTKSVKDIGVSTTKSEEHIIPLSLGNDKLILPPGTICDGCNNYFARKIENDFLSNESISKLRSYHMILSRKQKIPDLEAIFGPDKTHLEFDKKNNCCYIGLTKKTIDLLTSGELKTFLSSEIDIRTLQNNYSVSRFLVKVFVEMNLLYCMDYYQENRRFCFDKKFQELIDYVRQGNCEQIIYEYSVSLYKPIFPFSSDDYVASISMNLNSQKEIIGMTLRIFELEFVLKI